VNALLELLGSMHVVIELVRTGKVAIRRGPRPT